MKNLLKCQKTITIQQKTYQIICNINHYKLFGIDSSRQTGNTIPQQINLTRKSEEDSNETIFIDKKQQKNILNLSLDLLIITEKYKQQNIKKYQTY